MIQTHLEKTINLKSQSDTTTMLSLLEDSLTLNRTYRRDPHVNNIKTAALSIKIVQNDIIFRDKYEEIDFYYCDDNHKVSFMKKQQALFSNNRTRIWNDDDDSLLSAATTIVDSSDDWDDEYDDSTSQIFTNAVSEGELYIMIPKMPKKSVHFGNAIIREYSVTVGAFAATDEPCPIQLTWEYNSFETKINIDIHDALKTLKKNSRINSNRQSCKRLSLEERRLRIANIQDISLYDVDNLECETMIEQLNIEEENFSKQKDENNEDSEEDSWYAWLCLWCLAIILNILRQDGYRMVVNNNSFKR